MHWQQRWLRQQHLVAPQAPDGSKGGPPGPPFARVPVGALQPSEPLQPLEETGNVTINGPSALAGTATVKANIRANGNVHPPTIFLQ